MAVKRIVSTSFWTDGKVDTFSPEDKYFMLYLLTNPHTTQLGIYEFSIKHAAFEMGYSQETVVALLSRFQDRYGIIKYSSHTNEIAIKNYLKHSIVKGGKPVLDCLKKELKLVKNQELVKYVVSANIESENATVSEFIKYVIDLKKYKKNEFENENDNDNERIVNDSYHESSGSIYSCMDRDGVLHDEPKFEQTQLEQPVQTVEKPKRKTRKTQKAIVEQEQEEKFNKFWEAWPKKIDKQRAFALWVKENPDDELFTRIMTSLEAQKKQESWCKDGGKYIPNPRNWIEGKRWEDQTSVQVGVSSNVSQPIKELFEQSTSFDWFDE